MAELVDALEESVTLDSAHLMQVQALLRSREIKPLILSCIFIGHPFNPVMNA